MLETVIAALAQSSESRLPPYGDILIRSACETLAQSSPALIAALTVSLPADGPAEIICLGATARSLAAQYQVDAVVTVEKSHVGVRLTRRQKSEGRR